jgi:hypothetical protein
MDIYRLGSMLEREFIYVTVLDYSNGQVYLYDYDKKSWPDAEEFVATRHDLDNVHFMVHKHKPALWTSDIYYCTREQANRLYYEIIKNVES